VTNADLPKCRWSPRTALDPKHRPQLLHRPSSTVRREWARYPQEAHLLEPDKKRIRRLLPTEIVRIQGFDPSWFERADVSELDWIRAAGDAVPPPLSSAVFEALGTRIDWKMRTHVEIAAGAGGLASGARAAGFESIALVDSWPTACQILSAHWSPSLVRLADAKDFDFRFYRDSIGILSGGPPCQPWSSGGSRRGELDPRDLMGQTPDFIWAARPEGFVWENVPGLLRGEFADYFGDLMQRLRSPGPGLRYAVMAALLNAADFGLPQVRQRLFIVGLRDRRAADIVQVFDAIDGAASHRDQPWRTVEAITDHRAGGWMKWWYDALPHGVERSRRRGREG
jgi:site-specific DNA-cytosine methylase